MPLKSSLLFYQWVRAIVITGKTVRTVNRGTMEQTIALDMAA